jgi:hypothetical protein
VEGSCERGNETSGSIKCCGSTPSGGELKYNHISPASRKRRQKGNPVLSE